MAWLRLDDTFDTHPKVLALGTDERRWTWQRVLLYTCRHRTDVVPTSIRDVVTKATPAFVRDCIQLGLIDQDDNGTMHVHDWHEYNGSDPKAQVRERVRRHREKRDSNADVTQATVTQALPERYSRVGTRARPVPSPTPGTSPPSSTSRANPDDDDDLEQALHGIRLTGPARTTALELLTTDPIRLAACVTASKTASKPAAYLAELIRNGSHPEPQRSPYPTGPCPDCGQSLGHGHLEDCPRMPAQAGDPEPAAARPIPGPPPELLATVGIHPDDPEPAAHRTQDAA